MKTMSKRWGLGGLTVLACAALMQVSACKKQDKDVVYTFSFPEPNIAQFDVEILKNLGLGLDGEYAINDYATLYFLPQTPAQNFHFGFNVDTGVFVDDSWPDFEEVSTLPTGASFPGWMQVPVIHATYDEINSGSIDWHFYFGTNGQYTVGAAAVIKEIDEDWPDVTIGYDFYNDDNELIAGVLFFGPRVAGGQLISPGGIFIGSDITPFLPDDFEPVAVADDHEIDLGSFGNFKGVSTYGQSVNGSSVVADVTVAGKDKNKYGSSSKIEALVSQFAAASRRAN